ncbi:hypothetical protein [Segatella asaccharophila]
MAFKKQSVSEMWFWMTESHLRTCTQIPVRLSVSTKGCPDFTNQLLGQLAIDSDLFSFIRNKKSGTLWSALLTGCGHQLDTNSRKANFRS